MKLSQMSESQVQEVAALARLKPSLLKPAFVGDLDIEMIEGKPRVGEVDLRDHIADNSDILDDISTDETAPLHGAANDFSLSRYGHVAGLNSVQEAEKAASVAGAGCYKHVIKTGGK